jgi:transcriptional regulator with XRE-family HTH domain
LKKALSEKLFMLSRVRGISQTEIAEHMAVQVQHVNRYFNGRSDLYSSHLINLLKALGIDLDQLVSAKLKKDTQVSEDEIETAEDCVKYLLNSLDELGRQTYLSNLAWAAKVSSKKKLPQRVNEILKNEISLI